MQRLSIFLATITLALLTVTAHASICNNAEGSTGKTIQQADDGVGGTGQQAYDGVGGTGTQADSGVGGTGIVGVITGFASVCVNGLEVHFNNETTVDIDGQATTVNALNIGQVVAIASFGKDNELKAQHISVSHVIIGKVDKINLAQNTIEIMGQTIKVGANTIGLKELKPNQMVKLSGLVAPNNQLYALRLDLAAPNALSSIVGVGDSTGKINGIKINTAKPIIAGSNVQVSGNWDGHALQAIQVKESTIQHLLRRTENVIIQDIAPTAGLQKFNVQNQLTSIDFNTKISGAQINDINAGNNQTVIVRGKINRQGNITARSIEYLGIDKILERGGGKQRPDAPTTDQDVKRTSSDREKTKLKDKVEKPETREMPEKSVRPEAVERTEKIERPEAIEKPQKLERIEAIQRPDRAERPAAIERPEIIEKPEKVEVPDTQRY